MVRVRLVLVVLLVAVISLSMAGSLAIQGQGSDRFYRFEAVASDDPPGLKISIYGQTPQLSDYEIYESLYVYAEKVGNDVVLNYTYNQRLRYDIPPIPDVFVTSNMLVSAHVDRAYGIVETRYIDPYTNDVMRYVALNATPIEGGVSFIGILYGRVFQGMDPEELQSKLRELIGIEIGYLVPGFLRSLPPHPLGTLLIDLYRSFNITDIGIAKVDNKFYVNFTVEVKSIHVPITQEEIINIERICQPSGNLLTCTMTTNKSGQFLLGNSKEGWVPRLREMLSAWQERAATVYEHGMAYYWMAVTLPYEDALRMLLRIVGFTAMDPFLAVVLLDGVEQRDIKNFTYTELRTNMQTPPTVINVDIAFRRIEYDDMIRAVGNVLTGVLGFEYGRLIDFVDHVGTPYRKYGTTPNGTTVEFIHIYSASLSVPLSTQAMATYCQLLQQNSSARISGNNCIFDRNNYIADIAKDLRGYLNFINFTRTYTPTPTPTPRQPQTVTITRTVTATVVSRESPPTATQTLQIPSPMPITITERVTQTAYQPQGFPTEAGYLLIAIIALLIITNTIILLRTRRK